MVREQETLKYRILELTRVPETIYFCMEDINYTILTEQTTLARTTYHIFQVSTWGLVGRYSTNWGVYGLSLTTRPVSAGGKSPGFFNLTSLLLWLPFFPGRGLNAKFKFIHIKYSTTLQKMLRLVKNTSTHKQKWSFLSWQSLVMERLKVLFFNKSPLNKKMH